jgi:anti-sigma regulatory factor (Ser/Thr protein kinase)
MQESSAHANVPTQVLSERTHLVIPSLPHWIEPTVDYLRQKAVLSGACQDARAGKLLVALLEAISNAVIHGNLQLSSGLKERGDDSFARALAERAADPVLSARVVDILVDYDGARCRWVITDEGPGFDIERVLARCLSDDPEVMLASGRGILMMHSFLDEIRYDLGGRRLTLTLTHPSGAEKRRERRVPVQLPFQVAPLLPDGSPDLAAATHAVSQDFSEHGIALLQKELVEGQRVFIGIPRGSETVYVAAAVRHCRTIADGCVQLGCEFEVTAPPDAHAQAAGAQQLARVHEAIVAVLARYEAPALPGDERRVHPRVQFNRDVTLAFDVPPGTVTGYARDLSKGGMALISRVLLPLRTAVVSLPRDDAPALRIRARIVRCSRVQEGFFDVGLQFLRLVDSAG